MTLEERAKEFVSKVASGTSQEMDYYANTLVEFANETTKELVNEAEEHVKQNYCEMCVMADDCKCGCIDCFTVQAYIASAESREKRIAELEKENKTMHSEIGIAKGYIERIEKENAELKETLGKCAKMPVLYCLGAKETITKATEILSKLLEEEKNNMYWEMNGSDKSSYYEVRKQAEQFLNEVKK